MLNLISFLFAGYIAKRVINTGMEIVRVVDILKNLPNGALFEIAALNMVLLIVQSVKNLLKTGVVKNSRAW